MNKFTWIIILTVLDITLAERKYTRWANTMEELDYSWEAVSVITKDDYDLTLFHIFGQTDVKVDKPPILIVHDVLSDAANWIEIQRISENQNGFIDDLQDQTPWMLQLAEKGYDVWMANSRGTEYSQGHRKMYSNNNKYWDFTFEDMAKHDVPAMINKIKSITEEERVWYIGYSQGAAQMFTALADTQINTELKQSLHSVVALAPCVLFNTTFQDEAYFERGLYKFEEHDIHSFKGPNWFYDQRKICIEFDSDVCDEYKNPSPFADFDDIEYQPTSMKNLRYYWNNGFTNRYQHYNEGWREAELIDTKVIGEEVTISMFVPRHDELCPFTPFEDIKVSYIRWYEDTSIGHHHFDTLKDSDFVEELIEQLKHRDQIQYEIDKQLALDSMWEWKIFDWMFNWTDIFSTYEVKIDPETSELWTRRLIIYVLSYYMAGLGYNFATFGPNLWGLYTYGWNIIVIYLGFRDVHQL